MKTIVRGGTVVTATGTRSADVLIEDGRILQVGPDIDASVADEVIEAGGLHVFPGFIDPHVHTRDPGLTHKEDFLHATRAAAAGGITTILVMPNTVPPTDDAATIGKHSREQAPGAHVDFGLWALAVGNESLADLVALRDAGAVAVKLFWGYAFDRRSKTLVYDSSMASGELIPPASNGDVWRLFRHANEVGILIGVHCEDHAIVSAVSATVGPATGATALATTRPALAESVAVGAVVEIAHATGARAHVVHVSSGRTIHLLRQARADGVSVSAETCPHYLTLEPEKLDASGLKAYPPVRGGHDAEALWKAVIDGTVGSLSSDHAPHAADERTGPFDRRPAGIAGVQTMAQVLIDAFLRRQVPLEVLADRLSTGTARLYGIYPTKGSLEVGADADITIVDTSARWRIQAADLESKDRSSPWDGVSGRGSAVLAMVRGNIIMREGRPVGPPMGRWITPAG
jgi:dihydroorotase